jgi:hypothetical protein
LRTAKLGTKPWSSEGLACSRHSETKIGKPISLLQILELKW